MIFIQSKNKYIRQYLFLILFSFSVFQGWSKPADTTINFDTVTVLIINNIKISAEEFKWRMRNFRSSCFDYYLRIYQINNIDSNFWKQSHSGVTPLYWIEQKTIQAIQLDKMKIAIMNQFGILKDFNYLKCKTAFDEENQKREKMIQEGRVIYGKSNFDQLSFYEYLISNGLLEVYRKILIKISPSEVALKKFYNKNKSRLFRKPDTYILKQVVLPDNSCNNEYLNTLKSSILSNDTLTVRKLIDDINLKKYLTVKTIKIDPKTRKQNETMLGSETYQKSINLKKNQRICLLDSSKGGKISFLINQGIISNGFQDYNEVKEIIKTEIAKEYFNKLLATKVKHAKVDIKPSFKLITMDE